jgi:hypothetical protein
VEGNPGWLERTGKRADAAIHGSVLATKVRPLDAPQSKPLMAAPVEEERVFESRAEGFDQDAKEAIEQGDEGAADGNLAPEEQSNAKGASGCMAHGSAQPQ